MKNWVRVTPGYAFVALGHLTATAAVTIVTALLVMPLQHAEGVVARLNSVPQLWEMSQLAIALHIALSACIWALVCIVYKLVRLRLAEQKRVATVKLSRGTVVTETLIVMPIFLMLTFGMAQLTINSIGGILANIAAYEAARAAWVWQPEEDASDKRMDLPEGTAEQKCRIAVAFAMMPIAPGDFLKNPALSSDYGDKARMLALGANVPLSGVLSDVLGEGLVGLGAGALGAGEYIALTGDASYNRALDTSSFAVRSVRKFTTAFLAAECDIKNDHSVEMKYKHYVAMPVVGRIFGTWDTIGPGLLPGYYGTYERTFGFRKQINTPNRKLPLNELREAPALPEGVQSEDSVGTDLENQVDNNSDTSG